MEAGGRDARVGRHRVAGALSRRQRTHVITLTATDSASQEGSATVSVIVGAPVVTALEVEPAEAQLAAGTQRSFVATALYSDDAAIDVTDAATWESDDTNVVTIVSAGVVEAVAVGTANVTATFDGASDITSVTVTDATLTELQVDPTTATLPAGTSLSLTITGVSATARRKTSPRSPLLFR